MKYKRPQQDLRVPSLPGSNQAISVSEGSSRGKKLINRLGGDVSTGEPTTSSVKEVESLLHRLSATDGYASNNNGTSRLPVRPHSTSPIPMLSIKGAASKGPPPNQEAVPTPTLIDRMQLGEATRDGQGGWKKRRRQKAPGG